MSSGIGEAMGGTAYGEGRRSSSRWSGASRWGQEDDASERGQDTWEDARQRGARALSSMERSAEDAYAATRDYVYHHPIQALAGVTAFAFAVGALWRLGSRERRFGQDLFHRFSDYMEPQARSMRQRW